MNRHLLSASSPCSPTSEVGSLWWRLTSLLKVTSGMSTMCGHCLPWEGCTLDARAGALQESRAPQARNPHAVK